MPNISRSQKISLPLCHSYKNARYALKDEVAIEDFNDGSLLLLCEQLRTVHLNSVSRDILSRLNGERTILTITQEIARDYGKSQDEVMADVVELIKNQETEGAIKRVYRLSMERTEKMDNKKYLANPDVSCREEELEGGILFNPDTEAVQVINVTGLMIWQALSQPRTTDDIIAYLMKDCNDVPTDKVDADVNEFIETLQSAGFIGVVLDDDDK